MSPSRWRYTIPLRLRAIFHRDEVDREMSDEVHQHLDARIAELVRAGMTAEDARYAAKREFRGVEQSKEQCRDTRRVNWVTYLFRDLLYDVRFALRSLRKSPGFTSIAILTIALGIGANAAIFSVVNAVLLRPLPYPSPDRIVAVDGTTPAMFVPTPDFHWEWQPWADNTQSFSDFAIYQPGELNFAASGVEPERIAAAEVSTRFFNVLGIPPIVGRTFLREEEIPNHPKVAVISATLCRRFGQPQDVLGRTFLMNGKPTTVVGVMPFGFEFPEKTLIWLPAAWHPSTDEELIAPWFFFDTFARLKPGISPAQAQSELSNIAEQVRQDWMKNHPGRRLGNMQPVTLIKLHDALSGSSRPALLVLLGAVGFVLLIACADVANLLLARAVQRQREIALRAAMGASKMRLIRQMLTEGILLAVLGGVVGLAIGYWSLRLLHRFIPPDMLFVKQIPLDVRVLAFLFGVSVFSGIIFGLFPALHAMRVDLNESLKETAAGAPSRQSFLRRVRGLLAVAECAMALVLLVGAGLLMKSFWRLTSVDTGFQPESVITAKVSLPDPPHQRGTKLDDFYNSVVIPQRNDFYESTLAHISAIPGVSEASYVSDLPFGKVNGIAFKILLQQETPAHLTNQNNVFVALYEATPDYFRTMGIPLIAGRAFSNKDAANAPAVVIINESLAKLFWSNADPIGQKISLPGNSNEPTKWAEIVGIVGSTKHLGLDTKSLPEYYLPMQQSAIGASFLAVRISGSPSHAVAGIRQAVAQVNPTIPLSEFVSMKERISNSVAEPRFRTLLLGIFAGLALILAAAGIYGVMSYGVVQRTREIGIRMALGADRGSVLQMVLAQTARLTLLGIAIGLAASWGLTKLLENSLFGVQPHDAATLIAVSVLLSIVAVIASYVPARRAMRVDPLVALRYE
jgi:predicted permease